MVLNLTRPLTSAAISAVQTRREKLLGGSYNDGHAGAEAKFKGMPREELLSEIKRMRRSIRSHGKESAKLHEEVEQIGRLIASEDDIELWAKDFLVFEKPSGGVVGDLRQAFLNGQVLSPHEVVACRRLQSFEDVFEEAETFRIEHDWFKAIRKANEFENGSFRLPYETSIFEFRVSRKAVVAMCTNYASDASDNEIVMQLAIESFFGWSLSHNLYRHNGGHWEVLQAGVSIKEDKLQHLVELIGNQIRAACIALDADVAEAKLVRESHVGKGRDPKNHPEYEFYTINIASRTRAEALESSGSSKGTKRLHFRRGHWRHFTTSKTWVRWCLVGNPELGFIDKQYRL